MTSNSSTHSKHLLSNRNFRWLWLGQAISALGDKFTEIAIPIFVYQLTDSAFQLGFAFVAQVIASSIFGIFAGVLSDRWDHRRTMIGSDIIRAVLIFALIGVPLTGFSLTVQLVLIYALSFVIAAVKQFFMPAKIAVIPDLVEKEQLLAANSLDQGTLNLVSFLGFSIAGAIVAWLGVTAAFIVDGITFLLSGVCIAMIHFPAKEAGEKRVQESFKEGVIAGWRQAWSHPLLRMVVILSLIVPLAMGGMQPLLLVFATESLQVGEIGFGFLEATFGLGVALGVIAIGRYAPNADRGRLLNLGVLGMGLFFLPAALLPYLIAGFKWQIFGVSLFFIFFSATSNGLVLLGLRTIVQENTPKHMIGRVFNVIVALSNGAMVLGAASVGLADVIDVSLILTVWSIFLLVTGIISLGWYQTSIKATWQAQPNFE